jgi:hypothetical protein
LCMDWCMLAEVFGPDPDVPDERVLSQEHPAQALTMAAEGAELLVVGSHGRRESSLGCISARSRPTVCTALRARSW